MNRALSQVFCCIILVGMIVSSPIGAQEIALTFDDAPRGDGAIYSGRQRTRILLEKLQAVNVNQVAFFAVSSRIDSSGRKRLEAYGQAGHIIANHTHSHARIHRLGYERYIQDIFKADKAIRDIMGYRRWFRYPFLDEGRTQPVRDAIRAALSAAGYFNGYVTVDNYDWYLDNLLRDAHRQKKNVDLDRLRRLYIDHIWQSVVFYDQIARETLRRSPKHVLLLHENDLAALFIDDLVHWIRDKGWRIIAPEEAYQDAIAQMVPDVLLNNQGRVAAIAKAKGYAGPLSQESESINYLDQLFITAVAPRDKP